VGGIGVVVGGWGGCAEGYDAIFFMADYLPAGNAQIEGIKFFHHSGAVFGANCA